MKTDLFETPAFTIEPGAITVKQGGWRPSVSFAAPSTMHFDGRMEVDVALLLFDDKDRFIGRVGDESNESFIGSAAAWRHEVDQAQLDRAKRMAYDIRYELTYRRKITAGEIPELPAEADGAELYPWFDIEARLIGDRIMTMEMSLWATDRSIEINYRHGCHVATDSCRTEFDLGLLDDTQTMRFLKRFSGDLTLGLPRWEDTSIRIERQVLRKLKFFELQGETRVRAIEQLAVVP